MRTGPLIALIVAAALSIAVWLGVARAPTAAGTGAQVSIFTAGELPLEKLDRVSFSQPGVGAVEFKREPTGWVQTAPYRHPADSAAIRGVIETAASLQATRTVELATLDSNSRAALGLEPPQATVTLGWPGGERTVELGRRSLAGRAWVRVAGRPAAVSVDGSLHALTAEGDPRQWRSLALYDAAAGDADSIVVRYGSSTPGKEGVVLTLERIKGVWSVVAPVKTRADADSVRGYIEAIARAEADAFAADQPADFAPFGLAPPAGGVRIGRVGDAPDGVIDVGVPVAAGAVERFGRVDGRPAALQLGARALAALFPPSAFFIDPRGTDVVPADVRRITFTPALGISLPAFTLQRAHDGWTLQTAGDSTAEAAPVAANSEAVRRLLTQLAETRAPEISFSDVPAELRMGEFALLGEQGQTLTVVRVARESQDERGKWALDNNDGVLRVFPPSYDIRLDTASYSASR